MATLWVPCIYWPQLPPIYSYFELTAYWRLLNSSLSRCHAIPLQQNCSQGLWHASHTASQERRVCSVSKNVLTVVYSFLAGCWYTMALLNNRYPAIFILFVSKCFVGFRHPYHAMFWLSRLSCRGICPTLRTGHPHPCIKRLDYNTVANNAPQVECQYLYWSAF
jgi:hypothetical protein